MGGIRVADLTPFTLLDYPNTPSCIIWIAGCNLRCAYCYNKELVFGRNGLDFDEVLRFLKSRKGLLEGVVISGGEPTLHKEIFHILKAVKELGFLVKLDTNGTRFKVVEEAVRSSLVAYIALDFKAPREKFEAVAKKELFLPFSKTLRFLIKSGFDFEVRTTYHSSLLNKEDIQSMAEYLEGLGYGGNYYIQNFLSGCETIGEVPNRSEKADITEIKREKLTLLCRN